VQTPLETDEKTKPSKTRVQTPLETDEKTKPSKTRGIVFT